MTITFTMTSTGKYNVTFTAEQKVTLTEKGAMPKSVAGKYYLTEEQFAAVNEALAVPTLNSIVYPKEGTICREIWDALDQVSKAFKARVARKDAYAILSHLNQRTVRTQYQAWFKAQSNVNNF